MAEPAEERFYFRPPNATGWTEDFSPGHRRSHRADGVALIASPEFEAEAESAERWLHAYFQKFSGRSLAGELIAERRDEARRESGS